MLLSTNVPPNCCKHIFPPIEGLGDGAKIFKGRLVEYSVVGVGLSAFAAVSSLVTAGVLEVDA